MQDFQRYLIYNHAAGLGSPAPIEHVRAVNYAGLTLKVDEMETFKEYGTMKELPFEAIAG